MTTMATTAEEIHRTTTTTMIKTTMIKTRTTIKRTVALTTKMTTKKAVVHHIVKIRTLAVLSMMRMMRTIRMETLGGMKAATGTRTTRTRSPTTIIEVATDLIPRRQILLMERMMNVPLVAESKPRMMLLVALWIMKTPRKVSYRSWYFYRP